MKKLLSILAFSGLIFASTSSFATICMTYATFEADGHWHCTNVPNGTCFYGQLTGGEVIYMNLSDHIQWSGQIGQVISVDDPNTSAVNESEWIIVDGTIVEGSY